MKPRPWWKVIDWRIVLLTGIPAWLLIGGGIAIMQSKRSKPPIVVTPPAPPTVPSLIQSTEVLPAPRAVLEIVAAPHSVSFEVVVAPREVLADPARLDVARLASFAEKIWRSQFATPAAPGAVAKPALPKGVPDGCKSYGTSLHFVKSPVEAFKQGAKEDKLVFILHLAGNIEDDGFT